MPVAPPWAESTPGPERGVIAGRTATLDACRSPPSTRSSRPARSRARSPTRCRRGSAKGAVVSVRLGRSTTRGVVADVGVEAPAGIELSRRRSAARRGAGAARRPRALGRRLLRLDAGPRARARRAEAPKRRGASGRRRPSASRSAARPSRSALTGEQRERGRADRRGARRGRRRARPPRRRRRAAARPRSTSRRCAAALERGLGTIVLVPEIALAPQTVGRFRRRFGDRVAILHSALGEAERRDERDRIARGEARIVVGARSAVFAPMRGVGLIVVDEEHDTVVQAGVRPALRRAHRGCQARGARGRGRGLRLRDAAARELGAARAAVARAPGSARRCRRCGSSTCAARPAIRSRRRCSRELGAAGRDERRAGDPAPQPARRRAGDPLPRVRHRRAAARTATSRSTLHARRRRSTATTAGYARPVPARLPGVRLRRARADRRRDAAARGGAREARAGARADPARRGHRRAARRAARRARALPRGRPARCCSGRRWSRRATTSRASSSRPSSTPTPASRCPDFRAEERTFQLVTQLAGRSGRDAPGRVLVQTFQPDATPIALRRAPRRRRLPRRASSSGARRSATRPSGTSSRIVVSGPGAGRAARGARELRRGSRASTPTCSARRRAAAARPPPRAARREDDAAPSVAATRRPCSRPRRPRCAATG